MHTVQSMDDLDININTQLMGYDFIVYIQQINVLKININENK